MRAAWVGCRIKDHQGYQDRATHPETGESWPKIPDLALKAWDELGHYPVPPEACLINFYNAQAKMGLHQDRDEADLDAPVVSSVAGRHGCFSLGRNHARRKDVFTEITLGRWLVLSGSALCLAFHGIDRLMPGSSSLLGQGGRLNLTLRRESRTK